MLRRLVPFLSRPFREAEAKYKRLASHIKAEPARWLTCITTTNYYRGLTFATGNLYIEKSFDKQMIPFVSIESSSVLIVSTMGSLARMTFLQHADDPGGPNVKRAGMRVGNV